ncbi:hypothetical protein HDU84_002111 [Entophlyctis sp. JEL0112]|nr:hypothetical protein HDU84_002111 [Entophlyctis sp. JEL0112]
MLPSPSADPAHAARPHGLSLNTALSSAPRAPRMDWPEGDWDWEWDSSARARRPLSLPLHQSDLRQKPDSPPNPLMYDQDHHRLIPLHQNRNPLIDSPPDSFLKSNNYLLSDSYCAPIVAPNLSEEPMFYPRKMGDPPSPASTHYSAPSTRRNSVDLDPSTFGSFYSHRRHPSSHQNQPSRMYVPSEPVSPPVESSRSIIAPSMATLQSTGGGTAALTPDLAAQLTEAQIQLSLRKKQRDSIPPVGYTCRLCAIEGHWMENCILYKSNKHPQYNNAARAVALNIISPDSQIVLNSLPVVQKPKHLYTPKFFAEEKMRQLAKQEQLAKERQYFLSSRRSEYIAKSGDYYSHHQQPHQPLVRSSYAHCYATENLCSGEDLSPPNSSFGFPDSSFLTPRSGSRFEQIWKS